MPPPLRRRPPPLHDSSQPGEQSVQVSCQSEHGNPSKSKPQFSHKTSLSAPLSDLPESGHAATAPTTSPDRLPQTIITNQPPPSSESVSPAKIRPEVSPTTAVFLSTAAQPSSAHRSGNQDPIWNRMTESIKTPQPPGPIVQSSAVNFRSTAAPAGTLTAATSTVDCRRSGTGFSNSFGTNTVGDMGSPILEPILSLMAPVQSNCSSPEKMGFQSLPLPSPLISPVPPPPMVAPSPSKHTPNPQFYTKRPFTSLFKPLSNINPVSIPSNPIVPFRSPTLIDGVRTVCFTLEEATKLSKPFEFALLGKFFQRKPKLEDIRKSFAAISFKGHVSVGALKKGFVLIQVENKEDYSQIWSCRIWKIAGQPMKVFKWTPSFDYNEEPSVVPVWVSFNDLPIHFFDYNVLLSISELVGKHICIDNATMRKTRPSVARVCVEIDMALPRPSKVQILVGDDLFLQDVVYENLPRYCSTCRAFGHDINVCKKAKLAEVKVNNDLRNILKKDLGLDGEIGVVEGVLASDGGKDFGGDLSSGLEEVDGGGLAAGLLDDGVVAGNGGHLSSGLDGIVDRVLDAPCLNPGSSPPSLSPSHLHSLDKSLDLPTSILKEITIISLKENDDIVPSLKRSSSCPSFENFKDNKPLSFKILSPRLAHSRVFGGPSHPVSPLDLPSSPRLVPVSSNSASSGSLGSSGSSIPPSGSLNSSSGSLGFLSKNIDLQIPEPPKCALNDSLVSIPSNPSLNSTSKSSSLIKSGFLNNKKSGLFKDDSKSISSSPKPSKPESNSSNSFSMPPHFNSKPWSDWSDDEYEFDESFAESLALEEERCIREFGPIPGHILDEEELLGIEVQSSPPQSTLAPDKTYNLRSRRI